MERTEAWNQSEPTGRWRSLLGRARSGFAHSDSADSDFAHLGEGVPAEDDEEFLMPMTPQADASHGAAAPHQRPVHDPAQSGTYRGAAGPGAAARAGAPQPGTQYSGTTYGGTYAPTAPPYIPPAPVAPSQPAPPQPGSSGRFEWRSGQAPNQNVDRLVGSLRGDLGGPKVIAFANPKGGVHKTTATVLAAATIGGVRGRGVLAWDDNELRGTLGLRAGSARHARTIRHLIKDLAMVEATPANELGEIIDDYLRHASDGSYDVLAGEETPNFAAKLDQYTVRRVIELLRRTHDVICIDTGNNVESPNWKTVLQMADQLVVTSVPREDAAFTADWMLDLLNATGMEELAANAVTLLSCPTPNPSSMLRDLAEHFATRTRAVAVVPYDPMLESGSSIDHEMLAPATRRAWLDAAAVMLQPFLR